MNARELGYSRGSADKLARRPYNDNAPSAVVGSMAEKSFKQGYKKGFADTKVPRKSDTVGRFLDEVTDGLLEIEGRPRARGSEVIDAEIVEDDSKKP